MAGQGNNAAMREALQQALYFLRRHHTGAVYAPDGETLIFCEDVAKVVDAALAEPPRNCDVGTAEEQEGRFFEFCKRHKCSKDGDTPNNCPLRPVYGHYCHLAWAQMPYEEGGDHA